MNSEYVYLPCSSKVLAQRISTCCIQSFDRDGKEEQKAKKEEERKKADEERRKKQEEYQRTSEPA